MTLKSKLVLILLIFLGGVVAYSHFSGPEIINLGFNNPLPSVFNMQVTSDPLKNIVQKNLEGKGGEYAVYIETLPEASNSATFKVEKYYFNENTSFSSASLYKLVLMAGILQEIEKGRLNEDDMVSSTKSHLASVAGGVDFGYINSGEYIGMSVDNALDRVARVSDNFAAIMLTERLMTILKSADPLLQVAQNIGMENTIFAGDSHTTAFDTAMFFRLLYQKEILSPNISDQIIELLERNQINNRIPEYLPKDLKIAHKTGELSRLRHDAGIVFLPDGKVYLIVLMSQNLPDEDEGIETLAQISKDVYEYFSK